MASCPRLAGWCRGSRRHRLARQEGPSRACDHHTGRLARRWAVRGVPQSRDKYFIMSIYKEGGRRLADHPTAPLQLSHSYPVISSVDI